MKKQTTTIPATTTFTKDCGKLNQGIFYRELCGIGGRKFQIDIYRDTYDFQSHAKISVWTGKEWSLVDSLMYPQIEIEQRAIQMRPDEATFKATRNELICRAAWVCA